MDGFKIIALDLDGTLLDSQKRLSDRNRSVLLRCAEMGIQIVPTTGRSVDGIPEIVRHLPGVRYAITTNGAVVADMLTGEALHKEIFTNQKALEIIAALEKYPVMYDPYVNGRGKLEERFMEHLEEYGLYGPVQELVRQTRDAVPNVLELLTRTGTDVEKINVYMKDPADGVRIRETLSGIQDIIVTSSMPNNLEINSIYATKGSGLKHLADYLKISYEDTMAFGDGENDVTMIQDAGMGIVMDNAADGIKQYADYITVTNDQDGVAYAIERLVFGIAE